MAEIKEDQIEVIAIVAECADRAQEIANQLGVEDGKYSIETKYYSVKVPVITLTGEEVASSQQFKFARAVIVVDSSKLLHHASLDSVSENNDDVRIFFSTDETLIERCIDRGFELVIDRDEEDCGIPRVRDALKCRAWTDCTSADEVAEISPEVMMDQFDDLLRRVHAVRNASPPDEERRSRAAAIATELATLLGNESD